MIPGSNILNIALSVIARQPFQYYQFTGRTTNAIGTDVANYAAPITLNGSVQAVSRNLYAQNGLDFEKAYYNVFSPNPFNDVARDSSGDKIVFNGLTLQVLSKTDWLSIDGWVQILCSVL